MQSRKEERKKEVNRLDLCRSELSGRERQNDIKFIEKENSNVSIGSHLMFDVENLIEKERKKRIDWICVGQLARRERENKIKFIEKEGLSLFIGV